MNFLNFLHEYANNFEDSLNTFLGSEFTPSCYLHSPQDHQVPEQSLALPAFI